MKRDICKIGENHYKVISFTNWTDFSQGPKINVFFYEIFFIVVVKAEGFESQEWDSEICISLTQNINLKNLN